MSGTSKCGFCITNNHSKCRVSVTWYDSTWFCKCECRDKEVKPRKKRSDAGKPRGPRKTKEST